MEYANTFTTILNSIVSTFIGFISSFFDSVANFIYNVLFFNPFVTVAIFLCLLLFVIRSLFLYFSKD